MDKNSQIKSTSTASSRHPASEDPNDSSTSMSPHDPDKSPTDLAKSRAITKFIESKLIEYTGKCADKDEIATAARQIGELMGELAEHLPVEGTSLPPKYPAGRGVASSPGEVLDPKPSMTILEELLMLVPQKHFTTLAEEIKMTEKKAKIDLEKEKAMFDTTFNPETCTEAELREALAKLESADSSEEE